LSEGSPGFGGGLLAGAVLAVLALVLFQPLREGLLPGDSPEQLSAVEQAIEEIETSYFEDPDDELYDDASIAGIIEALSKEYDDKFSHYFDPEIYQDFLTSSSGQFEGVGMLVAEIKKGLRVTQVYDDAPADRGGIEAGDIVIAVDGRSIAGLSSKASTTRIKGEPGTDVTLTIIDGADKKEREVELERAEVRIPAAAGRLLETDGEKIAYVALFAFSNGAHGELRSEIERLAEKGAAGLILDLRGNGGGLLEEAVLVSSLFVEEGPIVTTEGRVRGSETIEAVGGALAERPMAVLVNGDTASASEIVTAALEENDIATVIGEKTFGKGTVQEVIELDNGGALDITIAEYLTGEGTAINGVGIKPDIKVVEGDLSDGAPAGADDRPVDEVLERAREEIAAEISAGSTDEP